MDVDLSVFPAVPVSCAVEFGRVWQSKAHPDFDIYDQLKGGGFVKRLRFEGHSGWRASALPVDEVSV